MAQVLRYLNNSDYQIDINNTQLYEMWNNLQTLQRCEYLAQEKVNYYLTQRYDLSNEFTNTGSYSLTTTYSASSRVIIDYQSWTSSLSYSYNQGVIFNGEGFICGTTSIGATTSFSTALGWIDLGPQYQIYSVPYPAPLFDDLNFYNQGDIVFWKGLTYTCENMTTPLNYSQEAQYLYLQYLPNLNVFPDDKLLNNNNQYWLLGSSASYVVPSGVLPTNTTYWSNIDNRTQIVLNWILDIVLFYLERAAAPRNIPDLRTVMYKEAIKMMEAVGDGTYTINSLTRQNGQGTSFRSAGWSPDNYNWLWIFLLFLPFFT